MAPTNEVNPPPLPSRPQNRKSVFAVQPSYAPPFSSASLNASNLDVSVLLLGATTSLRQGQREDAQNSVRRPHS